MPENRKAHDRPPFSSATGMPASARRALYAENLLQSAARLLSRMDREAFSPTYGCLDRNYWCWKFTDFPCGRAQEAVLPLSVLYLLNLPGNRYRGNSRLLEWIEAGVVCWARIQRRNGSHDEAYPGECSFVATGFSLYAVTEALLLLREAGHAFFPEIVRTAVDKAVAFLGRTDEEHAFISNHRSGCAAGLLNAWRLTGSDEALAAARRLVSTVLDRQSPEGWFSEYDGFDPGYETQGLYYLSRCRKRLDMPGLDQAMRHSLGFLRHFVQPDGTIGGEYARRQTGFLFPAGLEHLARHLPEAEGVCRVLARGVSSGAVPFPPALDGYNAIPVLGSLAVSLLEPERCAPPAPLPWEAPGGYALTFPLAGVELRKTEAYYAILSLRKGGALNIYGHDGQTVTDHGYILRRGEKTASTVWWETGPPRTGPAVRRRFGVIDRRLLTPASLLALRLPSILPASERLAGMLKKLLVRVLITKTTLLDATFERDVRFEPDRVVVTDRIGGLRPGDLVMHVPRMTSYHMGSAKYFSLRELDDPPGGGAIPATEAANRSTTHLFRETGCP